MKPLSIVIISYNRPDDLLELLKNINQLEKAVELLQEVIVVNNGSTSDYTEVEKYIRDTPAIPFRYFDMPENIGVARRTYAVQQATAPILVMLDDDSVLQNRDSLVNLVNEYENAQTSRPMAMVAFKVLYYDTLEMQVNALAHKHFEEYKDKPFFETYYFTGCGCAIKRDIIEKLGYFTNDFFYGMEEYELSFRILDAGYSILYSNKMVLLHKESPLGRKPKKEKLRMMWVNKSKVAYRYLPKSYFYSTACMWSLQYLRITGFNLAGFIKGWKEVLRIPKTDKRKTVSAETMAYLKKVKARLWY